MTIVCDIAQHYYNHCGVDRKQTSKFRILLTPSTKNSLSINAKIGKIRGETLNKLIIMYSIKYLRKHFLIFFIPQFFVIPCVQKR